MNQPENNSVEALKVLQALARLSWVKGTCILLFGAVVIVATYMIRDALTYQQITITACITLLMGGGVASNEIAKTSKLAITILFFQGLNFLYKDMVDDANRQAIDGVQSLVDAWLPLLDVLPIVVASIGGLVGCAYLVRAIVYIRQIAARIAKQEGSAIDV